MAHDVVPLRSWSFQAEGLHCIKCIRKIQSIENKVPDIEDIKVDLGSKIITVKSKLEFDIESFQREVEKEGFNLKPISNDSLDLQNTKSIKSLIEIGVAGFCASNIMLFSVADYVGASVESWSKIFSFLSATLFLPVLIYSSRSFYLNSYYAFKAKKLSIDSPLVLVIVGGAMISYYNLFLGRNEIYFDSISMFVFLLLSSRYLIFKIQNKYLSPVKVEDVYDDGFVHLMDSDKKKLAPIKGIKSGDKILIERNKFIPLDGELLSEQALIDDAFFSGEYIPKFKQKNDVIYAGSKVISDDIHLLVKKTIDETRLSEIVRNINKSLNEKTEITTLADKAANIFTLVVIAVSFLILAYFSFFDFDEGLSRVLALLVAACPCGLAIVIPLIQNLAIKKGLRQSLLIKKPASLESIKNIKAIYFDKTGTLTSGEVQVLESIPRFPNSLEKQIIYNLESASEHPIAIALKKWVGPQIQIGITNRNEKIGEGVSGLFQGDSYQIKSFKHDCPAVQLLKNNEPLLTIYLQDTLSESSREIISFFKLREIESFILSGDLKYHAEKVGQELGIPKQNIYSELSPEDKLNLVKGFDVPALYVGDGVNDSMAMGECLTSISMQSSANVAFKSSDVHVLSKGLLGVRSFFELSEKYMKTIVATVVLTFSYNTIFATLAIMGLINPLIAVFLMPITSLSLTFLALYLMSDDLRKISKINLSGNMTFQPEARLS